MQVQNELELFFFESVLARSCLYLFEATHWIHLYQEDEDHVGE